MTKLEMALMIIAAAMVILMLIKLLEMLALLSLRRTLRMLDSSVFGWHYEWLETQKIRQNAAKEKPPDAKAQAHADEASRAPMVRMAAETLRRRRSEALE